MNHYTDYIISRNIDTSVNNNMLKQLENSLKQTDATDYYRKRYRIESLYELAKNYAQIEWRCIEFR